MINGKPWDHPAVRGSHVVRMTREYPANGPKSVATCQCGWRNAVPVPDHVAQDEAIEAHWNATIAAFETAAERR